MKIISVIGARPQFVKAAAVAQQLKELDINEMIIHTGQHYDYEMSGAFFEELNIPKPYSNLEVGSGSHAEQTAEIMIKLEKILLDQKPDFVLIYGDTNSTLAAALTAVKLHIPIAHVESGARQYNLTMPEEVNRLLSDHISDIKFCVTAGNMDSLKMEGITKNVFITGDVMYDIFLKTEEKIRKNGITNSRFNDDNFTLATFHRPSNVDCEKNLSEILEALIESNTKILFPVHPRTYNKIENMPESIKNKYKSKIFFTKPLSYMEMITAELQSTSIITDSGGVQREAYFAKKPCITVFENTAWTETVQEGWNRCVKPIKSDIINALNTIDKPTSYNYIFGRGDAAKLIAATLKNF